MGNQSCQFRAGRLCFDGVSGITKGESPAFEVLAISKDARFESLGDPRAIETANELVCGRNSDHRLFGSSAVDE
jgi:hypothetical protein